MRVPPKSQLSETDICNQFITPALQRSGWTLEQRILREYTLRPGRIVVRGQASHRDKASMLQADYVLFHKPNVRLRNAAIPLPPLPELSRIVTCVTDLRQRLADREAVQARLAEALVEQIV